MSIVLRDALSTYEFDTLGDSLRRLSRWSDKEMITDREAARFIIQLFHQIPDPVYNSIQDEI